MRLIDSVMPEKPFVGKLSGIEEKVFSFVLSHWPSSALEIAGHFGEPLFSLAEKRRASSKYSYYLKKLVGRKLLVSKRFGNSLVVWPLQAEKLRVVHDILREQPL